MANYSSVTFITTHLSTDIVIRFTNVLGQITGGFNVCFLKNIVLVDKTILTTLEGGNEIVLDFATDADAQLARTLLVAAIDALVPNCPVGGGPLPPPAGIVSVTYTAFEGLRGSSSVVPTTTYQITDAGNALVFGTGGTGLVYATTVEQTTADA